MRLSIYLRPRSSYRNDSAYEEILRIDIMHSSLPDGRSLFTVQIENVITRRVRLFLVISITRFVWAMKHDVPREFHSRKLRTDRQIISLPYSHR